MRPTLQLKTDSPSPLGIFADDVGKRKSTEALINNQGDINASTKEELTQIITQLASLVTENNAPLVSESDYNNAEEQLRINQQILQAALDDPMELAALGDVLKDSLEISVQRNGFMRRFLAQKPIAQGQAPSVRIDAREVTASIATGPTRTALQIIRQKVQFIQEFYINVRPYVEQKDIFQASGDLLQETYQNTLAAILVQEDKTWKSAADDLTGVSNEFVNISGRMTPEAFAEMTSLITRWGIAARYALFASNLWQDFISTSGWHEIYDPVHKYEILTTGRLGTLYGVELTSDFFRHPEYKVLDAGDIYIISNPNQHGQYTDREGISTQPIDGAHEGVPGRGWNMTETMSLVIANSRSLTKGMRTG